MNLDSKMDDILPEITEIDDRNYIVRFIPKLTGKYDKDFFVKSKLSSFKKISKNELISLI